MSLSFSKKFYITPGALDFPLEVEIFNNRTVSALRIHRDCELEMFWVRFPIKPIPISLRGARIILGID